MKYLIVLGFLLFFFFTVPIVRIKKYYHLGEYKSIGFRFKDSSLTIARITDSIDGLIIGFKQEYYSKINKRVPLFISLVAIKGTEGTQDTIKELKLNGLEEFVIAPPEFRLSNISKNIIHIDSIREITEFNQFKQHCGGIAVDFGYDERIIVYNTTYDLNKRLSQIGNNACMKNFLILVLFKKKIILKDKVQIEIDHID
jgi:hypothetical protein